MGSIFDALYPEEEEEELTPSQKARKEIKTKSLFEALYPEPEPEPKPEKKPGILSRVKETITSLFDRKKEIKKKIEEIPVKTEEVLPTVKPNTNFLDSYISSLDTKTAGVSAQLSEYGQRRYSPEGQEEIRKQTAQEIEAARKGLPVDYEEPKLFGQIVDSVVQSSVGMVGSLGASADLVGKMTNQFLLSEVGQKINKESQKILVAHPEWDRPEDAKWWGATNISRAVVAAAPSLVGVIIAGIVAGPVGSVAVGFGLEGGSTYQEAINAGVSEKEAQLYGSIVGAINGTIEAIFPSNILSSAKKEAKEKVVNSLVKAVFNKIKKGAIKKGAIRFTVKGLIEGGTEAIQEFVSNLVATQYDENRILWSGLFESFIGGFGSGGIVSQFDIAPKAGNRFIDVLPGSAQDVVDSSDLKDTEAGNKIVEIAEEAKKKNAVVEIDTTGVEGEVVITPQGNKIGVKVGKEITVKPPVEPKKPVEKVIEKKAKPIKVEPIPKGLESMTERAKEADSVEAFVSDEIFTRSMPGTIKAIVDKSFKGKTFADKLTNLYTQATKKVEPSVSRDRLEDKTFFRGERGVGKFQGKTSYVEGRNFATDVERAKEFGEVTEYKLKPGVKVFEINTIDKELDQLAKEIGITESEMLQPNKIKEALKKKGYDVVLTTDRLGVDGKIDPSGKVVTDLIELTDNSLIAIQPVKVKKKITPKKPTKKAIEQRETRTAEREIAKAERSFYSASELKNITRIKRISRSKAFVEGDIETLRKKYPKLVEDVIEASRRRYGEGISDSEALDLALRVPGVDLSAPAGYATTGIYSTIESAEKIIDDKKPIEFPELVKLVKELTGDVPTLKSFKKKLGVMYARGKGEIKLAPEIFDDPVVATKVLAHEIGHIADYLPEGSLKRGNIAGRIATLNRNMKQLYRNLDDKKIRSQLKDLTQLWKPFDEKENPTFTKYRYSAPELYADAVSVLLNDPALLQQVAPDFYDGFFEYLSRKPEIETNYFKLLDLLGRGEEAINEDRLNRIYKGYKEAKQKRIEISKAVKPAPSWLDNFTRQHITKFGSIYKKYGKTDQGNGIRVSAKQKVREALEEMQYKANQAYLFLDEVNSDMLVPLKEIGVSEEEFGAIIQLERQVLGDRKLLANPEGLIGDTSERVLKHLRTKFTEDQVKVIKQVKDRFHQKIFSYVEEAVKLGIYNKETFDTVIEPNKNTYATFSVVKYINKNYIPSSIKKQVGTVREIENPLNSTILKTVSLINFIEVQKGKLAVVQDYKNVFSDEYEKAKVVRGLGGRFIKFRPKENYEVLDYLEDGKKVGIYVDPYVKKMFDSDFLSPSELHTAVRVSGAFNRVFKPVVTSYKLSWALYSNIIRDSKRTYKNLSSAMPKFVKGKKITLAEYVTTWVKAIPGASEFAKGRLTALTKEMLANKAFTVPFTQFDPIANQESVLAPILRRYNLLPRTNVKLEGVKKVFDKTIGKVLRAIETVGATFEATSKIAGYQITKRRIKDGSKLGFITRNYVGTPNFVEGGSKKQMDNNIFVFSNVMIQALRTDIELATNPKTRSGYWWKTMQVDIIPKMLMLAAAGGLLGEALKKMFDRMTEYDKTNYITVPVGMDGDRVVYLRIPQDETGRLFSSMVWKLGRAMQGGLVKPEQVADLTAGFLPSATPLWGIAGGWLNFLKGRNPYDDYRGRLIIDDYTWKAGGWPKISKMVQWTLNEAGLGAFKTYDDASKSTTEAIIEKIPVLKFMLKTSDYGLKERLSVIEGKIEKDRAKEILKKNGIINDYVKKAKAIDSKSEMKKLEKEMIEKIHGKKPEDKAEVNRDIKKLRIQTQKGENPYVDALIYANTNDEKKALLEQYQNELSTEEYNEVVDIVKEFKIVSDNVFKDLKKTSAIKPKGKIGLNLVKPAYAAEPGVVDQSKFTDEQKRWFELAQKYRKENPEWYSKAVGAAGETRMFGNVIGDWPISKKEVLSGSKEKTKATETEYNENIKTHFEDDWGNFTRVLKRVESDGSVQGENTELKHDDMDIGNYKTYESEGRTLYSLDKDGNKIPYWRSTKTGKRVGKDSSEEKEMDIDRGLSRINNGTFYDFKNRSREGLNSDFAKRVRRKFDDAGIKEWDDMLDLDKNIAMAKIIFDEQGWCAWHDAPKDLCPRK